MKSLLIILTASLQLFGGFAYSQGNASQDHLFAENKKSMVMVATGIPYVGIVEYARGISNRTTVGALIGITPNVVGYGLRVRSILFQKSDDFRVYFRMPMFYYDKTKELGDEPWVLTWPTINAEWKLDAGARLSVGAGVVAAACAHSLLGRDTHTDHDHHHMEGVTGLVDAATHDSGFMGGVWNTYQMSAALPVNKRIMFQSEIALVMNGFEIATDNWVGGPPVILTLGVTYSF